MPTALQDAEHMLASYRHMFNHQLEHDVRHYWDNHMSASFMVDPLGLRADRPDRRGQRDVVVGLPAQRIARSATRRSRWQSVVDAVGPEDAAKIVSTNIKKFLGVA